MEDKVKQIVQNSIPTVAVEAMVVETEVIRQIRLLHELKWGSRRISEELKVSRNTVRRYIRLPVAAEAIIEQRLSRRALDAQTHALAVALFDKDAAGNAVVVHRILHEAVALETSVRSVQRAVAAHRARKQAVERATVRYETPPGAQMQIDFGEKWVYIAEKRVKLHLFVAILGYSRRCFVRCTTSERMQDWYDGVEAAFVYFGGVTATVLVDNARALVLGRDPDSAKLVVNPLFASFCRDYGVIVKACAPYRARTKGKVEAGVKYVKHNCIAGISFTNFAALHNHIVRWMQVADSRIHGTTRQVPADAFARQEASALQPLPQRPMPTQAKRLRRRVASDCFVNVDDVRYSVPSRHVGEQLDVQVTADRVIIFAGSEQLVDHGRAFTAGACIKQAEHFDALYRKPDSPAAPLSPEQAAVARPLDVYEALVKESVS